MMENGLQQPIILNTRGESHTVSIRLGMDREWIRYNFLVRDYADDSIH